MDESEEPVWPPSPQVEDVALAVPQRLPFARGLKVLSALTLGLGVFPYLIYAPARLFGALPDERTWDAGGGTGSPWGLEPVPDMMIGGPMLLLLLLALVTLFVCMVKASEHRRWLLAAIGVGMAVVQLGLAILQLGTVFWAVE